MLKSHRGFKPFLAIQWGLDEVRHRLLELQSVRLGTNYDFSSQVCGGRIGCISIVSASFVRHLTFWHSARSCSYRAHRARLQRTSRNNARVIAAGGAWSQYVQLSLLCTQRTRLTESARHRRRGRPAGPRPGCWEVSWVLRACAGRGGPNGYASGQVVIYRGQTRVVGLSILLRY